MAVSLQYKLRDRLVGHKYQLVLPRLIFRPSTRAGHGSAPLSPIPFKSFSTLSDHLSPHGLGLIYLPIDFESDNHLLFYSHHGFYVTQPISFM